MRQNIQYSCESSHSMNKIHDIFEIDFQFVVLTLRFRLKLKRQAWRIHVTQLTTLFALDSHFSADESSIYSVVDFNLYNKTIIIKLLIEVNTKD